MRLGVTLGDSSGVGAEILVELRANSELARRLGRQGRRFVLEHYSPDQVAAAYLRALDAWF